MSALANWYPGHSVVDFCVIAAATVILVTATAWMVSLFLKWHPAIRHWVLLSALVASLASPFLALGFIASGRSFINVPLLIAEDTALAPELPDEVNPSRIMQAEHGHARFLDEPAPSVAPETFLPTHRTGPAKAEADRDNVATAEPKSPTVNPVTGSAYPFQLALVAVLLMWLCGTLVVILGLFRGVLFLRRLCRSVRPITDAELGNAIDEARRLVGARSSPAIGVSSLARSPMVAGLFRPIIVMPRNLLEAIRGHQLRDILMHEIAHVERRDNTIVLLQAIAKAAFWPIPFMHLLNRELERAREEICDNHVLACRDAVSYGETLLRVAHLACETEMPVGTVGILHWRGKLEDRIFGLIHKGRSKMTRMHPLIALGVLALFLSASAILCGTTIIAAQPPQTATPGDDRVTESSDDDSRKAQAKRDQPPAAEAPVNAPQKQEEEKEAFTAWDKEVGGLQAGLGFKAGEKRTYVHGETVTLVVRLRNVGKNDIKFLYYPKFLSENSPTVLDETGKRVSLRGNILEIVKRDIPKEVNLAVGKEIALYERELHLATGNEDEGELKTRDIFPTGKFLIQHEQVIGNSAQAFDKLDPALDKLATGKLELEVKEPEKLSQEKEAFTAWGKEVGGLQIGVRLGEQRIYEVGETATLILRLRNNGKVQVPYRYGDEYFLKNPPLITDASGKAVTIKAMSVFGSVRLESVAPGTEVDLIQLKLDLRPGTDRSKDAAWTIYGPGKFQIQYPVADVVGEVRPDLPAMKLTTGKLELEVKEPVKMPPEKEAFTAWGKKIGSLQAGLGFRPGEKRAYHHGEKVTLVLRVRNPGDESDGKPQAVEFKHIWAFFVENPPTITDAVGKPVQLPGPEAMGAHGPRSTTVVPGEEVELYEWEFDLRPQGEGSKKEWATIHGVGKFSLQCERVVGPTLSNPNHPNPAFGELSTGKLELDIKSDPPAAPEKQGAQGA